MKTNRPAILIGQRGWVWLCPNGTTMEGDVVVARGARVIRRWGTTNGVAQLLADGLQPGTILETPSTVRVHVLAVVALLTGEEEK